MGEPIWWSMGAPASPFRGGRASGPWGAPVERGNGRFRLAFRQGLHASGELRRTEYPGQFYGGIGMKNCLRGGAIMVPAVRAALSFGCSSSSKGGGTGTDTSTGTSTATVTGPSFSTVYGPILSQSCTNATCHYSGA